MYRGLKIIPRLRNKCNEMMMMMKCSQQKQQDNFTLTTSVYITDVVNTSLEKDA